MNYEHLGSAYGRDIFVESEDAAEDAAFPQGYSVAAVVLNAGWAADQLCWTLNGLYGNLGDWSEFAADAGARSFAFYGERAEDASNLCDALAYAWTGGKESEYDQVMASSHDEESVEDFVENLFSGEILSGENYAGKLQNVIFAVEDLDLAERVRAAAKAAIERHRFD